MLGLLPLLPIAINVVIGGIIGGILTAIFSSIGKKTSLISYSTRIERLAVSADDPVFGNVRVVWGSKNQVRNLYMASVEIENATTRDFENVDFTVYTDQDTFFLSESARVVNEPYGLSWSEAYRAQIAVPQGTTPTPPQMAIYYHRREFRLPVFNRAHRIQMNFLCTRPNDNSIPGVWVSTQLKGAKLVLKNHGKFILGVPQNTAVWRGLLVVIVIWALCTQYIQSVWITNFISLIAGLLVALVGAAAYKIERWLRMLIAG